MVDVLAATSGLVVGVGKAVLDSEKDNASLDRQYNDTIWVLDERGWYHRYTHLYSFDPSVKLGGRVDMGQKIATLGKEGGSGGWSHLHYEILSRPEMCLRRRRRRAWARRSTMRRQPA